ncbi:S49 family peptidase [Geminicoccaceae bacterium 1502E]|nr:S49 family peptidase [Geminicoccaceae bacterium 1502E]
MTTGHASRRPAWMFWRRRTVVPALRLTGVIGSMPLRGQGLSLAALDNALRAAFSVKGAPAVALLLNSPGGSPVQSALIAERIRRLADERQRKVLCFVEDVAASGGYWLATAADEIFVDASSLVGSIGVVSAGFGFPEALARLGVERRVHTTGESKMILDPFQPEKQSDLAILAELQAEIHERFKSEVRARRGGRLQESRAEIFDGRVWTGRQALELGLVDGLGHAHSVIRERYGKEAVLKVVNPGRGWLRRRLGMSGGEAVAMAQGALAAVEERALWQRFGL